MTKVRKKTVQTQPHNNQLNDAGVLAESPLSPQWAFVVQFRALTAGQQVCEAGRVEHLVSGRTAHFQSLEELTAYFARTLNEGNPTQP
jgi:hypothetical protein